MRSYRGAYAFTEIKQADSFAKS